MPKNVQGKVKYSDPDPFTLPVTETRPATQFTGALSFLNSFLPPTNVPREGLEYSAAILEEVMASVTAEKSERGNSLPKWRKYKAKPGGGVDADEFTNPNKDGRNLKGQPVEYFPLIVEQIQSEIESLVSDPLFGDSLAGYLTRIFANNTVGTQGAPWSNVTKLPQTARVRTTSGVETVNLHQKVAAGQWPFDAELLGRVVPVMGVLTTDPTIRNANISTTGEAGKIETTDPNFPQSPYGTVTPSGVPGTKPNFKMTAANRTVYNRINSQNSSLGIGKGVEDPDMGYGYLTSIPHMVHQLRFQPPVVETFPNPSPIRDYASNIFTNTTPNLPWVLSLPVERQIEQNWGMWLIKGQVGVTSAGASLRAYNNPSASEGGQGVCPTFLFFPPPTVNCSCGTADTAYFIWHSQGAGFTWDELSLPQTSRAKPKFFGRHTRLAVSATVAGGAAGSGTKRAFFGVGIRTIRVSNVNFQPFHYVIANDLQSPTGDTAPVGGNTGFDVNIMEMMNRILGAEYQIGGLDAIEAIQIIVRTESEAHWTCDTEDNENGTFVPPACSSRETCSAGSLSATVRSLRLYEPPLVGDPVSAYS